MADITLSPEERLRRHAERCDLAADEVEALLGLMRDARADTREAAALAVLESFGLRSCDDAPFVVRAAAGKVRALPVEGF